MNIPFSPGRDLELDASMVTKLEDLFIAIKLKPPLNKLLKFPKELISGEVDMFVYTDIMLLTPNLVLLGSQVTNVTNPLLPKHNVQNVLVGKVQLAH